MSRSKDCLIEFAGKEIFYDTEDRKFFINQFDLVLSRLIKSGQADGIDSLTMVKLLLMNAQESLTTNGKAPKEASEIILQEALKAHHLYDVEPNA